LKILSLLNAIRPNSLDFKRHTPRARVERQAMAWQKLADPDQVRPWFLRGSPAFEIVPELAPREDEAVLDKFAFSAFEGTPLAMILRDCGLIAFALVGIAIEIGIDPTVRHGADLGLVPIVVQDACGAGNREAAQRALANLAFMGDAIMTDAATFCTAMSGETAGRLENFQGNSPKT